MLGQQGVTIRKFLVRFGSKPMRPLFFLARPFKSGRITPQYNSALQEHGLRAFMGQDASPQPGDLKELTLHETAMAWVSNRFKVTRPAKAWEETEGEFGERLRSVAEYINTTYDVESLSKELPQRIAKLRDANGDRLKFESSLQRMHRLLLLVGRQSIRAARHECTCSDSRLLL